MNDTLQQWLATGAVAPEMLGRGLRLPDSTCLSYSFHELCPREYLDQILHQLAETLTLLAGQGLVPHRLTWTFQQGRIFVIARPDGALLALVTAGAAENVDPLVEEFFALSSGN